MKVLSRTLLSLVVALGGGGAFAQDPADATSPHDPEEPESIAEALFDPIPIVAGTDDHEFAFELVRFDLQQAEEDTAEGKVSFEIALESKPSYISDFKLDKTLLSFEPEAFTGKITASFDVEKGASPGSADEIVLLLTAKDEATQPQKGKVTIPLELESAGAKRSIEPGDVVVNISGGLDPEAVESERERFDSQLHIDRVVARFTLNADGSATLNPETIRLRWEHNPGKDGGWRETWTASPQDGKGDVTLAKGPCVVSSVRQTWTQSGGTIEMNTKTRQPSNEEWTVIHDEEDSCYLLWIGGWRPPKFRLDKRDSPPDVLVAEYLAWFEHDRTSYKQLARIEQDLVARGHSLLTAVASLCAARKERFLRERPSAGDSDFSSRVVNLAKHHLEKEDRRQDYRGEYLLQAIAASPMNSWCKKGHLPGWARNALERGVKAAPRFFPDEGGDAEYARGIDLLDLGHSTVKELKKKYAGHRAERLFEGW